LVPVLSINGTQNIERATESTIKGVFIEQASDDGSGLKASITMNIERFSGSSLFGIVAEKYPNNDKQGVEIPDQIKAK
jgi:hypothetical protein